MCSHFASAPGEDMPFDKYQMVLDQLAEMRLGGQPVTRIRLDGNKEPLLYPKVVPAIEEAKKRGFAISLITNGTLLDYECSQALVQLGVDGIQVSITGITVGVFKHFQGFGMNTEIAAKMLEKVKQNVSDLVEIRNREGGKTQIHITYINNSTSASELRNALLHWKNIGIDCFAAGGDNNVRDSFTAKPEKLRFGRSIFCMKSAIIASNGDVFPCCQPLGEGVVLGNCFDRPLKEVLASDSFVNFFTALATLDYNRIPKPCRGCGAIAYPMELLADGTQ
jgi:radical SAM protein with 4Fe4S-binding SPASM domain